MLAVLVVIAPNSLRAAEPAAAMPATFGSANFVVHTDLSPEEAKELLGRLETMLGLVSDYWRAPLKGQIECYVVKDLSKWPAGSIPSEDGRRQIEAGAGVTITEGQRLGNRVNFKSTVYATADRGTPQHEAVHAYCGQTFGTTGPVWYSEGMAELGQYWRADEKAVNCHPGVVDYIHSSPPKTLNEIVNGNEMTGDSWQNYAWRWALCHLLENHSTYQKPFHFLGSSLLTGGNATFEGVLGQHQQEISFEYLFFLRHFEIGYRVDLCEWDWKTKSRALSGAAKRTKKVDAGRGWQATQVDVVAGKKYEFAATGQWQTAEDAEPVGADGGRESAGRLVGVVLGDPAVAGALPLLSEPFDLGAFGTFTAPADGQLFLRCRDAWGQIADNSGKLSVVIKIEGQGKPLPMPKPAVTAETARENRAARVRPPADAAESDDQ